MKATNTIRTLLTLAILAAVPCFAQQPFDDDITVYALTYARTCRYHGPVYGREEILKKVDIDRWCLNWSDGVQQALAATGNIPKEIDVFDLMKLTIDYIDRHHEKMGMPTIDVMILAIREAEGKTHK